VICVPPPGIGFAPTQDCTVTPAPEKREAYVNAKTILHEGRLAMPVHPRLRQQLRDVVAKPMPGGGTQITSPQRPDGSHGDLVSALVNALWAATQTTESDTEVFRTKRSRPRHR
jgi:phage terminase large subunit-like protein